MSDKKGQPKQAGTVQKRPYAAPKLTNCGSVARMTQSGSFVGNDGNTKCVGNAGDPQQCS